MSYLSTCRERTIHVISSASGAKRSYLAAALDGLSFSPGCRQRIGYAERWALTRKACCQGYYHPCSGNYAGDMSYNPENAQDQHE